MKREQLQRLVWQLQTENATLRRQAALRLEYVEQSHTRIMDLLAEVREARLQIDQERARRWRARIGRAWGVLRGAIRRCFRQARSAE